MIFKYIRIIDPTALPEYSLKYADIWAQVVDSIIKEMLAYADTYIEEVHINLREEMAFELAYLISFLSERVVADRMKGRTIKEIDPSVEYDQCFSESGKEKISTTAKDCAEAVWLKKYKERWKPKTESALKKEKNKKKTRISPKRVDENHFIPKSFIKRYWAEGQSIFRNTKNSDGTFSSKIIPVGSWGYRKNLYSRTTRTPTLVNNQQLGHQP